MARAPGGVRSVSSPARGSTAASSAGSRPITRRQRRRPISPSRSARSHCPRPRPRSPSRGASARRARRRRRSSARARRSTRRDLDERRARVAASATELARGRARGRPPALVLHGREPPRGAARQGARGAAPARADPPHRRPASSPTRPRSPRRSWMGGVFHSMVTQGHVSINRLLSTHARLPRACSARTASGSSWRCAGGWQLLDVPSAFEMSPSSCRWIYKHAGGTDRGQSWAAVDRHELRLVARRARGSRPCRFLISHHVALNGDDGADAVPVRCRRDARRRRVRFAPDTDLGRRFPDGSFRIEPAPGTTRPSGSAATSCSSPTAARAASPSSPRHRARDSAALLASRAGWSAEAGTARRGGSGPTRAARSLLAGSLAGSCSSLRPVRRLVARATSRALGEILPWFAHDALIHYLAPRGLEQYSGGGWGTRDVCQGPVELLLALGRFEPMRDLLLRVFRDAEPRRRLAAVVHVLRARARHPAGDSHGDIVFWPVLALAHYLLASEDARMLDERAAVLRPARRRARRARDAPRARRARARRDEPARHRRHPPGRLRPRRLERFAPAGRIPRCASACAARGRSRSTYQTLTRAGARRSAASAAAERGRRARGDRRARPRRLPAAADADGVLTGLRLLPSRRAHRAAAAPARREHRNPLQPAADDPRDPRRPVHARAGRRARRADPRSTCSAPTARGSSTARCATAAGPAALPARGERSTFFGREIGLMYMHAHLRYAEALAHYGDAEAFFLALCQANPIALRELVARRAPAPGQLLLLELRRRASPTATRPARYAELRGRAGRARGRLARLLERRRHRGAPDPPLPARPAPRALAPVDRSRCCRARSTVCASASSSRVARSRSSTGPPARARTDRAAAQRPVAALRASSRTRTAAGAAGGLAWTRCATRSAAGATGSWWSCTERLSVS